MPPALSVVVVAYAMDRELPRTLATWAPGYQRGLDGAEVELIVVDNGSPRPVDPEAVRRAVPGARTVRVDPAPPSPARAANLGVAAATADVVGLVVDGARMASPGLAAWALVAHRLAPEAVVATVGYHLGSAPQGTAAAAGHDQAAEDALLADLGWEEDGYRLLRASCLASSSGRGWFGPMGETSALFLRRATWERLGGLDEAFDLPGGGLVNHDLYRRACSLDGTELVVLLGEGTFHQVHGGATTSSRVPWATMAAQYKDLRGEPYRPPQATPTYVGTVPPAALEHVARSAELAILRRTKQQG